MVNRCEFVLFFKITRRERWQGFWQFRIDFRIMTIARLVSFRATPAPIKLNRSIRARSTLICPLMSIVHQSPSKRRKAVGLTISQSHLIIWSRQRQDLATKMFGGSTYDQTIQTKPPVTTGNELFLLLFGQLSPRLAPWKKSPSTIRQMSPVSASLMRLGVLCLSTTII